MAKQNPIKCVYNASKIFKEVRHYKSEKPITETNLLTEKINISKDRKFNNSINVSYWLKIRCKNKWSNAITGLKDTHIPLVYYGDIATISNGKKIPKHLLIFHFTPGGNSVTIYLFENYYPFNTQELNQILNRLK